MTPDRLEKLNSIGFVWSVRGESSTATITEKIANDALSEIKEVPTTIPVAAGPGNIPVLAATSNISVVAESGNISAGVDPSHISVDAESNTISVVDAIMAKPITTEHDVEEKGKKEEAHEGTTTVVDEQAVTTV